MNDQKDLFRTLVDLLDGLVEVFLAYAIEPLLEVHCKADHFVEHLFCQFFQKYKAGAPKFLLKAGAVSYGRLALTIPTIVLLSWSHWLLAAIFVLIVHAGSFWENAVAESDSTGTFDNNRRDDGEHASNNDEHESFEVVTTGSPHCVPSWARMHRALIRIHFESFLVDNVFAKTCLLSLLQHIPNTGRVYLAQYSTMIALIVLGAARACITSYKHLTSDLIAAPHGEDAIFDIDGTNPKYLQKLKTTVECVGIVLYIQPFTRYLGLLLLILTVPLEYELLRKLTKKRVLYYVETGKIIDHKTLKRWMQMKSIATKLVVGVPRRDAMDMVMNACASNTVDEVVVEAPTKADLLFIEKKGIDFVIVTPGQTSLVTDEVIGAERVLILGEHGNLGRVLPKSASHKD